MLSLRRNGAPTPWEACAWLLGCVGAGRDVVAVTPPGSYLARRLRDAVDPDHLFAHCPEEAAGPMADALDEDGIPVVLGENDRDRRHCPTGTWLPVQPPTMFRRRRLDTVYFDSHAVGLLVLDCPSSGPAVLRGAARILAVHQPAIVLDLTAVPPARRIAVCEECVAAAGPAYTWHDGLMLCCNTAERRSEAVLACAASVVCALTPRMSPLAQVPPEVLALASDELEPLVGMSWTDWHERVAIDRARFEGIEVIFDQNLPATGFHPSETDGRGTWWRWTGPTVRSAFMMPVPGPGDWLLRFDVLNWGIASGPGDIRVSVAGHDLRLVASGGQTACFGPLMLRPSWTPGSVPIGIVVPETRTASAQDGRRVGLNISRCTLERA